MSGTFLDLLAIYTLVSNSIGPKPWKNPNGKEWHWYEHNGIGRVARTLLVNLILFDWICYMSEWIMASVTKTTNRLSIVQGHEYQVIGVDDSHYRIIDESGQPALYPKVFFVEQDFQPPKGWIFRDYGEGEYSYDVPEFSARGFYEDYADGDEQALIQFHDFVRARHSGM